ncbi:hypothetical protein PSACC_00808 [Paramicrosporidium saccamoebae]|uniref:B30.2/SPRY domain-containing protein n=1 Tax=Paramicrosporidium saccamoebae TaxID=1246581 RepID=A0A2H9TNI0_9FUNG|nr:hypothetical protein PSACC_00808 [Paramicrosporidium saccamoebae]
MMTVSLSIIVAGRAAVRRWRSVFSTFLHSVQSFILKSWLLMRGGTGMDGMGWVALICRFVTMGVVEEGNDLEKLIGWEERSIGYHGDDGKVYNGAGAISVRSLNPYGTDDTVGCLINFHTNQVLFTKNGQAQGALISYDLTRMKVIHAAISSKSPASSFKVNFGADPFLFDICAYVREQKQRFYGEINKVPDLFPYQELALVYGYLRFHGHVETAEILWKTSQMEQLKPPNVRASTGKMQKLSLSNPDPDRLSCLEISLMQLLCCIAHASEYGVSEPAMVDPLLTYTCTD